MGRKKSNEEKSKKQQSGKSLTSRHALEKQLLDISKLLAEQQFETVEEANAFLNELLSSGQGIPSSPPATPLEEAQDIMYEAFEAHGRRRIKLARKALKLSEDCADAYVLLADEAARSAEEALELYEKGVRAAEQALGSEKMADYEGRFWGVTETRPYMRARAGLAGALWALNRRDEAIDHLRALLHLNPNDNQGLRYFLASALLETERYGELGDLLRKYPEGTAYWTYTTALLEFRQTGDSPRSTQSLHQALEANPYVPDYLLGLKKIPRYLPEYVGLGDESEATDYVANDIKIWQETPGALEWLSQHLPGNGAKNAEGRQSMDNDAEGWLDSEPLSFFLDEPDPDYVPFELDEWLNALEIPRKEHAAIRQSLRLGVGAYSKEYFGRDRFKRETQDVIDEQLEAPLVFGYAAIEILNSDLISNETKEAAVNYALITLQPTADEGIPYGLLEMLGFLARQESLAITHLMVGLLALEFNALFNLGPDHWTDGATSGAMEALATWIAGSDELKADEKLWLAWKISVQCDNAAHLGKMFANTWLEHPSVPAHVKKELCWSWLEKNREVGTPHYFWQLMYAYFMGDAEEVKRLKAEHGEALSDLPPLDLDETPPPDNFILSLRKERHFILSPYLKRLAIPWLVRLGEDFRTVIELFWEYGDYYSEEVYKTGVCDAIREFHDRLEPEELRRLIERGINHGKVQVRKPFYHLSMTFYGDQYLEQALEDNAASLRRWAANKLGL